MPQGWSDQTERKLLLSILEPDVKPKWDTVAGLMDKDLTRNACWYVNMFALEPPLALAHSSCLVNASRHSSVCRLDNSLSLLFFFHPTQTHHKICKQISPDIILLTQRLPFLSNSFS
jgi:hypothetical protein